MSGARTTTTCPPSHHHRPPEAATSLGKSLGGIADELIGQAVQAAVRQQAAQIAKTTVEEALTLQLLEQLRTTAVETAAQTTTAVPESSAGPAFGPEGARRRRRRSTSSMSMSSSVSISFTITSAPLRPRHISGVGTGMVALPRSDRPIRRSLGEPGISYDWTLRPG